MEGLQNLVESLQFKGLRGLVKGLQELVKYQQDLLVKSQQD